jgi:hypothetical protein
MARTLPPIPRRNKVLKSNFNKLKPGIYSVYWRGLLGTMREQDCLAAVGISEDGTRWIAPTDSTRPMVDGAHKKIEKITRIL